jgi:hypothetical protein
VKLHVLLLGLNQLAGDWGLLSLPKQTRTLAVSSLQSAASLHLVYGRLSLNRLSAGLDGIFKVNICWEKIKEIDSGQIDGAEFKISGIGATF